MEKSKSPTDQPTSPPKIDFRREEDFTSLYANNAYFESTSWDLKITFGQVDISAGDNVVAQHTAITMPWPYVKIFAYLLQTHLAAREAEDGRLVVPRNMILPPPELPKDVADKLKHPKEGVAAMQKLWDDFVAANPEVKP